MGQIIERLLKKHDEVFEVHRISDEARFILQCYIGKSGIQDMDGVNSFLRDRP